MYAIVDIETTGGNAASSAITEIAVVLYDGEKVVDRFATLIDPGCHIPHYITALTGISNATVAGSPSFAEVAESIYNILNNKIFVAHNVNFDHSFLQFHLKQAGYDLKVKKLCTVRYARKIVPGLQSYSLGRLCQHLGIAITDRHRATGDVNATVLLLQLLMQQDEQGIQLKEMLKGRNPHSYLPMHVPVETIEALPYTPGVYYFKDQQGKVLYVGKAVNLKFRVRSHFTNNASGRRRQDMIRKVYSISYTCCATELMAFVLESVEIKRLWPEFNRSQKRQEPFYGLYCLEDRAGRMRLVVEKKKKNLPALHTFAQPYEGLQLARRFAAESGVADKWILGQYDAGEMLPPDLNDQVGLVAQKIVSYLPTFIYREGGMDEKGNFTEVLYLIEGGRFTGMAATHPLVEYNLETIKNIVQCYPENETIRHLIFAKASEYPDQVITLCPDAI